jgi:hypothetical protein
LVASGRPTGPSLTGSASTSDFGYGSLNKTSIQVQNGNRMQNSGYVSPIVCAREILLSSFGKGFKHRHEKLSVLSNRIENAEQLAIGLRDNFGYDLLLWFLVVNQSICADRLNEL